MTVIFSDNFESGSFQNWSYIQAQDPSLGPGASTNYVGTGASFGIPAHSGADVAQFQRPDWAVNQPHAKVYKEWSNVGKRDAFGRVEEKLPDGGSPNGVYSAWFYLPSDYQASSSDWANIFQFKEEGYINGQWQQNPSWWLNMSPAKTFGVGGNEPVIFANHWNNSWNSTPKVVKAPLGRWFQIKAELHENDRIDWYLDNQKFDTSVDSTYEVGRFFGQSNGWMFGVGHYGGAGKIWVDDVSVTTLNDTSTPTSPPATTNPIPAPTPSLQLR